MKTLCLWILNTFFNGTPCKNGLVNNVEAYSRKFLDSTLKQEPKITMEEFLKTMDKMDKCMKSGEDCSILGGIVYKGGDILLDEISKDFNK